MCDTYIRPEALRSSASSISASVGAATMPHARVDDRIEKIHVITITMSPPREPCFHSLPGTVFDVSLHGMSSPMMQ